MAHNLAIQENVPLAPLTTLKIGGNARFFVRAETEDQIIAACSFAMNNDFRIFILGGGSNVVVSDDGFDGLIVQVAIKGISFEQKDLQTMNVVANAGEDWDQFVDLCVDKNLQGIECLSGIPGFIGGTPVQNVGAYGQEVSETIMSVRCFDRKSRNIVELNSSDCKFSYRASIFNTTEKERFVVLAVKYLLQIDRTPKIVYADLQKHFDERLPTIKETRELVLKIRAAKSMVIDKSDPNSKSVGSFFKNPVVSKVMFENVQNKARQLELLKPNQQLPCYAVDDASVKIPAAWLIENSGFNKGYAHENVGLSTKHSLSIINRGQAKAIEVLRLQDEIQKSVMEHFDILLIPEPVFVGFE